MNYMPTPETLNAVQAAVIVVAIVGGLVIGGVGLVGIAIWSKLISLWEQQEERNRERE